MGNCYYKEKAYWILDRISGILRAGEEAFCEMVENSSSLRIIDVNFVRNRYEDDEFYDQYGDNYDYWYFYNYSIE